ncbi:MAG TPA: hypothetical protein PKN96_00760 [Flavobacterium sp.]|uniref:hypothetical protein n=1 Tax=Flavobacterium sp. TaxID=239 RepID=UPI002CF5DF1B|nr:hypothetical protein [Flavobacterium sp.]HNP31801.1 hypothetical protein [Flavobacterium sp.]
MVRIVDYKAREREDGEQFFVLIVQGGLEAVKSQTTGKTYFTTKSARVPCTFDEDMCRSLVGNSIPGTIKKVEVDPYEYINQETGETIESNFRYEYISDEEAVVQDNVLDKEEVM